jgi:UDP-glucose 4-epimerase
MKILVVGGAGYIGSITAKNLIAAGHDVVVLDNLSRGHKEGVPRGAAFVHGDLGDGDLVSALLADEGIDAVMHFAALSLVGESCEQPAAYYANNVVKGLSLLDSMRNQRVNKFIFSSTAAVFGEPAGSPILEDFPLAPTNPYGDSKLAFEKALRWYSQAYGLKYVALRYFNAAGAHDELGEDHEPETHLIPVVLQVAAGKRANVTVFGDDYKTPDGTAIRDYIHVRDLAAAHVLAVEYLEAGGACDVFNLGNGTGYSVKEIIEAARRVTSHPIPAHTGPRRPGDPPVLIASSEKIKRVLNWQPQHAAIDKIIGDAWTWHQKHPNGYKTDTANV